MTVENTTVLTFLAHPDDAEILCAGTLIRLRQAGWSIHMATATAGDCGTTTRAAAEISAIRREEARASAARLDGVYHCLEEPDGFVVYDQATLRKTYDLFRRVAPSLVMTHPREDYMMDHEMVHLLARAAAFLYSAPNISTVPLSPASGVPHLYYCDPIDATDNRGREVEPTTLVDITGQMDDKTAMLATHASQREWLREHHGVDAYIDAMKQHAAKRGACCGRHYAEAFVQHRGHAFPANDLLADLFE